VAIEHYESVGVDYDVLDAAKRDALANASQTQTSQTDFYSKNKVKALMESQGEPAFVFRTNGSMLATVLECLGTKSIIAREYVDQGGPNLFRSVGEDGVAAIVNDLICVGALPMIVHAYFATGAPTWYENREWHEKLLEGWRAGCDASGAVWGGGESPTLSGLVAERDIEIAGSAVGFVPHLRPILGDELEPGDEIVLVESTGLHCNGASLARATAQKLPDGYRTLLPSGREFGAALLDASAFYVPLVAELSEMKFPVTYYSHITGHGLRKLMRAHKEFTYRITELPPVPEVLAELCRYAEMDDRAAYGTFNMGAGFAVFCKPGRGQDVVDIAKKKNLSAMLAGLVEEGPRRVILEPIKAVFEGDELRLRNA
jgi:phosphoribosylformylglycinamidine cyclo-ligase